jgi:hypothetical protein
VRAVPVAALPPRMSISRGPIRLHGEGIRQGSESDGLALLAYRERTAISDERHRQSSGDYLLRGVLGRRAPHCVVQHPAALEAGTAMYLDYFPAMYRRAAILQDGTAVLGFLGDIVACGNRLWLAAAVLLGSAVPLTLLAIKPVNDVLMSPGASRIADVSGVFAQWGVCTSSVPLQAARRCSAASWVFYGGRDRWALLPPRADSA